MFVLRKRDFPIYFLRFCRVKGETTNPLKKETKKIEGRKKNKENGTKKRTRR